MSTGDDTHIAISESNALKIVNILNSELNIVFEWLCVNRLKLNINKTKCIIINSRYKLKLAIVNDLHVSVLINNAELQIVEATIDKFFIYFIHTHR